MQDILLQILLISYNTSVVDLTDERFSVRNPLGIFAHNIAIFQCSQFLGPYLFP